MGLIKSANAPVSMTAFSMQDIEAHARSILLKARRQAEQLIIAAQQEGEALKTEAQAEGFGKGKQEGFAEGFEAGKKSGHAQALTEHGPALVKLIESLTRASQQIEEDRHDLESQSIREVVKLAAAIARRVTKRQGMLDEEVLMGNIKDAMSLVVHATDVRIALNPSQKSKLEAELPALKMTWPQLKHVEIVEDAAMAPGGAKIFTAHGNVDGDLDVQLDRVINELMPETSTGAP